jgi:hypothetical protein
MEISTRLTDLADMHPRLLWDQIGAATAAVLADSLATSPFRLSLDLQDVPGFSSGSVWLTIDPAGISGDSITRLRRTYEAPRLIELAAIGVAGLGLYNAGGHVMWDVALRGTGADYLIDETHHLLEVAGRSRRSDFATAWQQRWERLEGRAGGYYLCVVEFETPAGRLAFRG